MSPSPRAILTIPDVEDGFALTGRPALRWRVETAAPGWMHGTTEVRIARGTDAETHRIPGPTARSVWPSDPIAARETVEVSVRVTGSDGAITPWSEPVRVTGGVLDDDGWSADFIGGGSDEPVLLRSETDLPAAPVRATLYATAFGAARVSVNGSGVDLGELAPGWTDYPSRVDYDVADVTGLLRSGANALGVELAGGWYSEAYGFRDAARRFYEGPPSASAFVVLEYADGSSSRWATDMTWRREASPAVSASIYQGEHYDARRELPGWDSPGFDDASWMPVVTGRAYGDVVPGPRIAPRVRVTEELAPVSIVESPTGATIVDFGQNLVGRVRLRVDTPAGTRIRLRHAEVLEHGELSRRPLRNAAAEDVYIARGGGEEWEPSWTFHGFRYLEVDGIAGALRPADVTARVLGTDLARTGGFETDHPLVQQLHRNIVWGARGNFLSIPTDCPQRDERLGWTGDVQVFAPTAAFLFDSERFIRSWMTDVLREQSRADGIVPMVVPAVIPQVPGLFEPIAAWGDAVTIVPSTYYEATGDDTLLAMSYDGMRDWIAAVLRRAGDGGLWEDGRQFGDWLDPDAPPDLPGRAKTDPDIVATAYLFRSATLAARAATHLGRPDDAERYCELAAHVRRAFRAAYVTPTGRIVSDATAAYALALVFGIAEDHEREAMGARLRHLVRRGGYHIDTGFAGTPVLPVALTQTGNADAASRLLLQTENPSWLYPVTMGATTVWERWDSMLEDGSVNPGQMTSFNHFALGAVADWLQRAVAGLAPVDPGYARFRFAPETSAGLDDAAVWHESPHGRIEASWRREAGLIRARLVVPPNTVAEVRLPDGVQHEVGSGTHEWEVADARRAPASVGVPSLDGPMTDVVDDPEAYRVLVDTLEEWDADYAKRFRRTMRWTPGRSLRDPLDKVPVVVMDRIAQRLGALRAE